MQPVQPDAITELSNSLSHISIASSSTTSSSSALSSSSVSPEQVMQKLSALIAPLVTKDPWGFYQPQKTALRGQTFGEVQRTPEGSKALYEHGVLSEDDLERPDANGLCHLYIKNINPTHFVMKETNLSQYLRGLAPEINPTRLPASHFYSMKYGDKGASVGYGDETTEKIYTEVQKQIENDATHLAGEELLMHLTVYYLLSQYHGRQDPSSALFQMVRMVCHHFFQGKHSALFESLYGHVDWFWNLIQNLNPTTPWKPVKREAVSDKEKGGFILCVLAECQRYITQTLSQRGRGGLFAESESGGASISCRSRFLDWYMLCHHISKLCPKASIARDFAQGLVQMQMTNSDHIPLFVSMCSVLDAVLHGVSLFSRTVAQKLDPELTFEKWMKTTYFSDFCHKVLFDFPDMSGKPGSTAVIRGFCMYAPHYLHTPEHDLCINHFSKDPGFKTVCYNNKGTLVQLLLLCHKVVRERLPQKKATIFDLHRDMGWLIKSMIVPESLHHEVVRAVVSFPDYENHAIYFLSILSACFEDKEVLAAFHAEPTIEKWQKSNAFISFCVRVLVAIEDKFILKRFVHIYLQSGISFTDVLLRSDNDLIEQLKDEVTEYLARLQSSQKILDLFSILFQKKVDNRFLVLQLTGEQFRRLYENGRLTPRYFFPGFLDNTQIPVEMRYKALVEIAQAPSNIIVSFEHLEECLRSIVGISSQITEKNQKTVLQDTVIRLLHTPWRCPIFLQERQQLSCSDLFKAKDLDERLTPLYQSAALLVPDAQHAIRDIFANKLIIAIKSIVKSASGSQINKFYTILRHVYEHYYPVLGRLLSSEDPQMLPVRKKMQSLLSFSEFLPLCFVREFSNTLVCSIHEVDSAKIEETAVKEIEEIVELCKGLSTAFVEPRDLSQSKNELYFDCIKRFISEMGFLGERARAKKFVEAERKDLVVGKNALLQVISSLYKKIDAPDLKKQCFVMITSVHTDTSGAYSICTTDRAELSPTGSEGGSVTFRAESKIICLESPTSWGQSWGQA